VWRISTYTSLDLEKVVVFLRNDLLALTLNSRPLGFLPSEPKPDWLLTFANRTPTSIAKIDAVNCQILHSPSFHLHTAIKPNRTIRRAAR